MSWVGTRPYDKSPAPVLDRKIDIASLEQCLMQLAMQRAKGNLSQAARLLGITRPRLAYRLRKEGLPPA